MTDSLLVCQIGECVFVLLPPHILISPVMLPLDDLDPCYFLLVHTLVDPT